MTQSSFLCFIHHLSAREAVLLETLPLLPAAILFRCQHSQIFLRHCTRRCQQYRMLTSHQHLFFAYTAVWLA